MTRSTIYFVGWIVPVLAAASSGVGECQGRVKGVWTKMVARFATLWQSGKRARVKQSARRHSEHVDTQAGLVYTRGHRVNFAPRPT